MSAMHNEVGMTITPLGGGQVIYEYVVLFFCYCICLQEVGRSCIILQYQHCNIMLDCGCHPGRGNCLLM